MKKFITFIFAILFMTISANAEQLDTNKVYSIDTVSVVSFYRNSVNVGSLVDHQSLVSNNHGQEPSHLFKQMPAIFSMSDNGTEFGYGYFRIRGLDQTRINVTLDGMPWNEAEDYGTYFANSPDLMSSLQSIKVERGSSATNNGTASSGGSINLESIDLLKNHESYAYLGGGSFNTYKVSVVYNSGLLEKANSALHIKATQQKTDGYKDYGFNNSQALTLKYGYFFNDKHSIDVMSLNGNHRNGQGWLGNTLQELYDNPKANGNLKTEDDHWFQTINKIQYKGWFTNNILFTASTYLQYQTGWYNFDLDNYMWRMYNPTWMQTDILYTYGLTHYLYGANIASKFYINDLSLTCGVNAYRYQREHYMNDKLNTHFKNVDPVEYYDNTGYKNDVNAFIAASYKFKNFNFGANVQYRYVDFSYVDHYDAANNFTAKDNGTLWNFVNYGINIDYNINNYHKLYVRYAEVSREPTRTDMFGGNEFYPGELTTNKAERSYDVELGYVVSTDKIKANVNAYYMFFKNERVLNGEYGLNGLPLHDTADKSYRTGAEVTLDWNIFQGLHYALNASGSENRVNSATFKNKYHILTPAFTVNNDLYWEYNNLKVGINDTYHSKMYIDQNNDYSIPYYNTVNVYASYRYNFIEVSGRINNILNKVNYYNAAVGASEQLWFREAGANFFADVKFYF